MQVIFIRLVSTLPNSAVEWKGSLAWQTCELMLMANPPHFETVIQTVKPAFVLEKATTDETKTLSRKYVRKALHEAEGKWRHLT